jgi:hypothetical protein
MTAAQTAHWFLRAGAIFVVTYAMCWALPRAIDNIPHFPATTTDREQAAIFDDYFKRPTPTMSLVGSSLAVRLKEEYFERSDFENLALSGGSPLTGLTIIDRASKTKPAVIAVETNILSRAADDAFIARYRDSTQPVETIQPMRTLAAMVFEKRQPRRLLDLEERKQILRSSPTPLSKSYTQAVSDLVANYNLHPHDDDIQRHAEALKALIDDLRSKGVVVYLFQMPVSPEFERTRYVHNCRAAISRLFDPADQLDLDYAGADLHWVDGQHLDDKSALIVAGALEQALVSKLDVPLRRR